MSGHRSEPPNSAVVLPAKRGRGGVRSPRFLGAIAIVLGLLLVLVGGALLRRSHGVDPVADSPYDSEVAARARLLSDSGGPISLAVTALSSARRSVLRNAALINRIVNALPPEVALLVLVDDPGAFTITRNPWPERVRFIEIETEAGLTIWPQDPFLVLEEPGRDPVLLASRSFERADDARMAEAISDTLGWTLRRSALRFEGGNIVADSRHAYVGENSVLINASESSLSVEEVVRRFEAELGREVVVIGPAPQPVGHIDMIITPLGKGRIALADPRLGARIAARSLASELQSVRDFERRSEERFFGHAAITEIALASGESISAPSLIGQSEQIIAESRALADDLDRIGQALEDRGHEVVRIPYLGRRTPVATSDRERLDPRYPTLTYNNVLLEARSGSHRAYIPRYGWPALDDAAIDAWAALGYEVYPVEEFSTSAMYGGALRCAVKVLRREKL